LGEKIMGLVCLIKGHDFRVVEIDCQGIPYAGSNILEFVDYKAVGKCRKCQKSICDSGRTRVAYFGQPCTPVLASTPSWICDSEENTKRVTKAVEEYLETIK